LLALRQGRARVVESFVGEDRTQVLALFLMVLAALVASLVVAVAVAEPAGAIPGSDPGSIAFTSNDGTAKEGSFYNIYLMDADGHGLSTRLTDIPGDNVMPAWSPDGTEIAYVRSGVTGIPDIYLMDADGSNEVPLISDLLFNTDPAWYPDGRKIAFSRSEDIYAMSLDDAGNPTEKLARLTRNAGADRQPVVSPNGEKIAFASDRDGDFDIYVMKARPEGRTNRPVKLSRNQVNDFDPDWAPDGGRIAFSTGSEDAREICVMKAVPEDGDTNPPINLTNDAADDSDPAWSPGGEIIAFTSDRTGDDEIWRMEADGTDPTNLTRSPNSQDIQPDWQPLP